MSDAIFGYLSWFLLYFFYGFVGVSFLLLPILFLATIWLSEWGRYLALTLVVMGAVGGIITAERARRRGELIHKHQRRK